MDRDKKNCFTALSTEDIRKLANNWTLASDVGLLAHLEQFAEKICNQAQITQNNFHELLHDYEELHSTTDNITNQFLALQNCQFVENRVYDEETPVEEKMQEKVINEDEKEKLLLMQYKNAVEIGIKLLDTHFQEVLLPPGSDSEEEDESGVGNSSLIWRPKNPYVRKKFPVLIGSVEWWSDDNVGLRGCEKNLETEKVLSESESEGESLQGIEKKLSSSFSSTENDKNISNNLLALDSSAEDMVGLDKDDSFHKNSIDNFKEFGDAFISTPSDLKKKLEYQNETVEQRGSNSQILESNENLIEQNLKITEKVNLPFTQELDAKLRSVLHSNDYVKSKNETSEHKKIEKNFIVKNFFKEEDRSDLFSVKIKNSKDENNLFFNDEKDDRLFNDSNNLFFESKTNIFDCDSVTKTSHSLSNSFSEELLDDSKSLVKKKPILPEENLSKTLFADLDDDEILFNSHPINVNQSLSESLFSKSNDKLKKVQSVATVDVCEKEKNKIKSLYENDIDDALFSEPTTNFTSRIKSKNQLGNVENLVTNNTKCSLDEESSDLLREETGITMKAKNYEKESLNTSKKSEFPSDISVAKKNTTVRSSLKAKIFNEEKNEKTKAKDDDILDTNENFFIGKKTASLTKLAIDLEDDDISLFLEKTNKPDILSISSSRSSLFDDVSTSKSLLASVFEKDKCDKLVNELFSEQNNSLFAEELFIKKNDNISFKYETKNKVKKMNRSSLFDDYDDIDTLFCSSRQNDDLFENDILTKQKNVTKLNIVEEEESNFSEQNFTDDNLFNKTFMKQNFLSKSCEGESLGKPTDISFENLLTNEVQTEAHNFLKTTEPVEKSENSTNQSKEIKTKPPNSNNGNFVKENYSAPTLISAQDVFVKNPELFGKENLSESIRDKLKPPNSLDVKKDFDLLTNTSKDKGIGKLNIPDDLKTKFESIIKPCFSESKDEKETVEKVRNQKRDSDVIFDESLQTGTNLLKCPSKDRVKIPVRRRPQSRRARQEAIRNSGSNLLINTYEKTGKTEIFLPVTNNNENVSVKKESLKNFSKSMFSSPALSNPLSPSTDEEDYFNVPELDTNFEKEDQRIFKSNLFQSENVPNIDDPVLFDVAPILSPLIPKNKNPSESKRNDNILFKSSQANVAQKKNSVFGDDDEFSEDDDCSLFKSDNTLHSETSDVRITQKFKNFSGKNVIKKPLFDASDTYEDLFGEKLSNTIASFPNKNIAKGSDKNINITEKSNQPFVDPLGIMFNGQK